MIGVDSGNPIITPIEDCKIFCFQNGKSPSNDREVLNTADFVLDVDALVSGSAPQSEDRYQGNLKRQWSGTRQLQHA